MRKITLIFSIVLSLGVGAQTLDSVRLNKEGVELLTQQNFLAAQEKFLKALAKDPFHPAIHLNLGLPFLAAGNPEKAQASFLTALKYSDEDTTKFLLYYNLGVLKTSEKKIDEALGYYQKALELNPESHETKVNIELLIQQNGGQGKSDDKDKDQKDQKDQKDKGDGKDQKDKKEQDGKDGDKDKEKDKPKEYEKNKPQPRKFKSDELTQADVNKILGEIKQQEQKIRQDYNRKDVKERPRGKDW